AGKSLLVSAKDAVRIAAFEKGMRLIAASSDIDLEALSNSIHILAKLDVKADANRITITAKEEVVINGGTSYTHWNAAGIENGTKGMWREHAAVHSLVGPSNKPGPRLPEPVTLKELEQKQSLAFILRSHPTDGRVFADEPYTLYKGDAKVEDGVTDENGQLIIKDHQKGTPKYTVKLSNGHEFDLPVKEKLEELDDQLAARGFRAAQDDAKDRLRHQRHREGN
ncbi:hypothetical protein RT97_27850, partial [Variovorax paradoxus]